MNEQNLKPTNKLSKSEVRALGAKGGRASGKARREKKALREAVAEALAMPAVKDGKAIKGADGKPLDDMQAAVVAQMLSKALDGDVRAAQQLIEWLGELDKKPEVENNIIINVSES